MNIAIHAPPRTGGFSVRSVFNDFFNQQVYHVHYLMNHYYYINKANVRNRIEDNGRDTYKIICTIRDPIARNLSEYWRLNFIDRPEKPITQARRELGLYRKPGTDEEKFSAFVDHYRQHHFFGSELIPFWEIDIFREGFESPYTIYDDRLLVIRCEDLNEYGVEAINQLTGHDLSVEMPHGNVVPTKRSQISLTEAYIEAMYRDKWFPQFFYNQDEIDGFKNRWYKTTTSG